MESYASKLYSAERMLISRQKATCVTVTTYTVRNLQAEKGRTQIHEAETIVRSDTIPLDFNTTKSFEVEKVRILN